MIPEVEKKGKLGQENHLHQPDEAAFVVAKRAKVCYTISNEIKRDYRGRWSPSRVLLDTNELVDYYILYHRN